MKIIIKKDGSLILDGEGNTTITKKVESGINFKIQGNNAHPFTDFIKIEGDPKNNSHEIINFLFKNKSDLEFGNKIGGVISRFDWASAWIGMLWGFALGLLVATFKYVG